MNTSDLKNSDGHTAYNTIWNVWGKDAIVHVYLEGGLNKKNCSLVEIIPRIDDIFKIISARDEIAKALKSGGMLDRAEEWVYECEPASNDKDNNKFMVDGVEVRVPITLDEFAESLSIVSLAITFDGSVDNFSAEAFICCLPDYFAGHSINVEIYSDGSIECRGLAG